MRGVAWRASGGLSAAFEEVQVEFVHAYALFFTVAAPAATFAAVNLLREYYSS